MRNRNARQPCGILMQTSLTLLNDLGASTQRRVDELVWLLGVPFQTAGFAEHLDFKAVLAPDGDR